MGRRFLQVFAAVVILASALLGAGMPARADNISLLLTDLNAIRLLHGLAPLVTDPTLTTYAQNWSNQMASTQQLAHDPNLNAELGGAYSNFGQNVGFGGTVTIIFNDLVNSPPHLAIMLTDFTSIGIGVASSGTYLWVTEDFGLKGRSPQTTVPAPTPTTTSPVPTTRETTTTVRHAPPPPPGSVATATTTPATPPSTTTSSTSTTVAGAQTSGFAVAAGVENMAGTGGRSTSLTHQDPAAAGTANLSITTSHPPRPFGLPLDLAVVLCAVGLAAVATTSVVINRWARSR